MSSLALNTNLVKTMSSREIAELTGKRHDHVMTDIRNMCQSLKIDSAEFSAQYKDDKGRTYPCFNLPKRESIILVSGYDIVTRAKIIDRWQELESQVSVIPQSLPEALRLAADLAEQKAEVDKKLAIAAPKLEVYDLICESDEALNVTEAAKVLQIPRDRLKNYLFAEKWIYRRHGSKNMLGYADKVQQGLIVHKLNPFIDKATGEQRMGEQPRITGKGLVKLAKMLGVSLPSESPTIPRRAA